MFIRQGKKVFKYKTPNSSQVNFSFWHPFGGDTKKSDNSNIMIKVLNDNAPNFLKNLLRPDIADHLKIQKQTLELVNNPEDFEKKLKQARENLAAWAKDKKPAPNCIQVVKGDWGDVTLQMTSEYGMEYAALNMANAHFVGGGTFSGGSAQEEDMWLRTTCPHWILEDPNASYIDEKVHAYIYTEEKSKLINAKLMMNEKELEQLSKACGKTITSAYKIHMDTAEPEICFKGRKIIVEVKLGSDNGTTTQEVELNSDDGSYVDLPPNQIFPFHELRSAAVDLSQGFVVDEITNKKIFVKDEEFSEWFEKETLRRIEAQLDTALLNGIRNLVLGAFGCGEFKNNPEVVAKLYKEAIEKRADQFDHIVFAIYNSGRNARKNFAPFYKALHGIKLGAEAKVELEEKNENRPSFGMGNRNNE